MLEREKKLLPNARNLRRDMTPQERKLWYDFLKSYPMKWYKQKIIGNYIVDFYCDKAKLVIELDGSQHYEPENQNYDRIRSEYLKKQGSEVLQYSNREVNEEFSLVCEHIHNRIAEKTGFDPYMDLKK